MSIQKTITLTEKGSGAGPTYTLSYSSDCSAYTSSVIVTLSTLGDSVVVNVPDNTLCIKLTSRGQCTNEIIEYIGPATTTTSTTTTAAPLIQSGLVAWQSCDSLSGSIWYDKSINGNDALVSGSTLVQSGSLGIAFNGTNNFITYKDPLTATPSGSWTLQWYGTMYNDNINRDLFCKDYVFNGWDTVWQPTGIPTTTLLLYRDVYGSDKRRIIENISAQKALWTLVGSNSDGVITVYKNATLVGNMTAGGVNAFNVSSLPLKFGFNTNGDATYFKGTIQDLIVYNRELSDVEISANYDALSARSCPAGPTTTTTTAVPTTTTTTIAPTTTTTTIEPDLYYTGVDCCGGDLTCKIMVKGGVAGGQPTPFPYGMYIPGKGCFNITALSTEGPVDFSFTTFEQKNSYWYGESLCSFCVSTYGCPTTTTTAGPTTTTTAGPTTTTTSTTTTTTLAPTTTTTTIGPIGGYFYYAVANNCCTNTPSESIVGIVAVTSSLGILIDGQTLGNNDYTSSQGTHCVSVKYVTSSVTPLLFTIEASQASTNTYGLGQCNSCNRDFIPTPASGVCLDYDLVNAEATLTYVSCSGTPTSASMSGGTFEFCSRTTPVITYTSNKADARLAVACTNCGTYTTTTTLAP